MSKYTIHKLSFHPTTCKIIGARFCAEVKKIISVHKDNILSYFSENEIFLETFANLNEQLKKNTEEFEISNYLLWELGGYFRNYSSANVSDVFITLYYSVKDKGLRAARIQADEELWRPPTRWY